MNKLNPKINKNKENLNLCIHIFFIELIVILRDVNANNDHLLDS